jgi:hypothetical protein
MKDVFNCLFSGLLLMFQFHPNLANAPQQTFLRDEQSDNWTGPRRWNTGPYEILFERLNNLALIFQNLDYMQI